MTTIYLAGPMRGYDGLNFNAFDRAQADLEGRGYTVLNPAALDRKAHPGRDLSKELSSDELDEIICTDLEAVLRADGIALLPGWEASVGAKAERGVALWAGKKVYMYPEMHEQRMTVAPTAKHFIPQDDQVRKDAPMARGLLFYFPAALFDVAAHSLASDRKHNPGNTDGPHWARKKSPDHADCIVRHLIDAGTTGTPDRKYHLRALAWRALALLQEECEAEGAAPGVSSR